MSTTLGGVSGKLGETWVSRWIGEAARVYTWAGVAFASPDERGGMTIPPRDRISKPVFQHLSFIDMMALWDHPHQLIAAPGRG